MSDREVYDKYVKYCESIGCVSLLFENWLKERGLNYSRLTKKEIVIKYGTDDMSKIMKKIDKRAAYGPAQLGEIGLHDDDGAYAISHSEDARMAGIDVEDMVEDF